MAIAFQSAQSATVNGGSLVITKPVSTAVGDLLVAVIATQNTMSTAPSGWTQLSNQASPGSLVNLYVYYIFATSTEVAASNFTWTAASNVMEGGIARITGNIHTVSPVSVFAKTNAAASTTPSYAITVTPTTPNSILLFCIGSGAGVGTNTSSTYAIVTSNPSWTEAFDVSTTTGGGSSGHAAMAYGSRAAITATGNASAAFSANWESSAFMVVVRPQFTVTLTETLTMADTLVKKITKLFTDTLTMSDTLASIKSRLWRSATKPVTTWRSRNK